MTGATDQPQVPGYVLHERLGAGRHGQVHRAEPAGRPGRIVAVKRVRSDPGTGDIVRLREEAEALSRLSHPSVLALVDVVVLDAGVALVTPYAPGGTLASQVAARPGGLPAGTVADLGQRLASALAAAHDAGVVHGDVKPANVFFDAEGQPLLADFGTARLIAAGSDTEKGADLERAGTPEYLAPELAGGSLPSPAGDQYALGVTLYEALTGALPHAGSTVEQTLAAARRGRFVPVAELVALPVSLAAAVEQALAPDSADRHANLGSLAAALDAARRELEASDGVAPSLGRSTLRPRGAGTQLVRGAADTRQPSLGHPEGASAGPHDATEPGTVTDPPPPGERTGTVVFGPGPPPPTELPPTDELPEPRWRRRSTWVATGTGLVLVVASLATWALLRSPSPSATTSTSAATARAVPAPCPGSDAGDGAVLADLDGAGCGVPVTLTGNGLEVARPDGTQRFELDAGPADVLVAGDWSCDGADGIALYRPGSGEVFRFDRVDPEAGEVVADAEATGVVDGTPTVITDADGCDRVVVEPAP